MNDAFSSVQIHTVRHLTFAPQFIIFIIPQTKGKGLTREDQDIFFLDHQKFAIWNEKKRGGYKRLLLSLQMHSHSLQWRLMVSWPGGEECQLSPQLHSQAKSRSGRRGQRSLMMWFDPAQSMDVGSWPLVSVFLMEQSREQMVKRADVTTCELKKKKAWRKR